MTTPEIKAPAGPRHRYALGQLIAALVLLLVAMSAMGYVTFSWFLNQPTLNTVAQIEVPSKISILDKEHLALAQIDLAYTSEDLKGTQVTLERPFCIESTAAFYLELAYTTNINGLTCTLYPAVKGTNGEVTKAAGAVAITGSFLNQDETTGIATDALHTETYGTDTNVQINAEPLYWRSNEQSLGTETGEVDGTEVHYSYYVLEITWDSTMKETDMLYLMAIHSGAVG